MNANGAKSRKAKRAKTAPQVLKFDCRFVADGRELSRPVNDGLARIEPALGAEIDPKKRPFVVVDARAGRRSSASTR